MTVGKLRHALQVLDHMAYGTWYVSLWYHLLISSFQNNFHKIQTDRRVRAASQYGQSYETQSNRSTSTLLLYSSISGRQYQFIIYKCLRTCNIQAIIPIVVSDRPIGWFFMNNFCSFFSSFFPKSAFIGGTIVTENPHKSVFVAICLTINRSRQRRCWRSPSSFAAASSPTNYCSNKLIRA